MNLNKEGYTWEVSEDGEVAYTPIKKGFAQSWEELKVKPIYQTTQQEKASIAVAQLTQLLYEVHEGWEANWLDCNSKHTIILDGKAFYVGVYFTQPKLLSFETEEKAENFLDTHEKKIKEAAPILFGAVL